VIGAGVTDRRGDRSILGDSDVDGNEETTERANGEEPGDERRRDAVWIRTVRHTRWTSRRGVSFSGDLDVRMQ